MQTTPCTPVPEPTDIDPRTEHAKLARWQRRAHAFAWACGIKLARVDGRDEME